MPIKTIIVVVGVYLMPYAALRFCIPQNYVQLTVRKNVKMENENVEMVLSSSTNSKLSRVFGSDISEVVDLTLLTLPGRLDYLITGKRVSLGHQQ